MPHYERQIVIGRGERLSHGGMIFFPFLNFFSLLSFPWLNILFFIPLNLFDLRQQLFFARKSLLAGKAHRILLSAARLFDDGPFQLFEEQLGDFLAADAALGHAMLEMSLFFKLSGTILLNIAQGRLVLSKSSLGLAQMLLAFLYWLWKDLNKYVL